MTNWRARVRLWAFACVAGLAVTGCTEAGDGEQADSPDTEAESPLDEYLGGGGTTFGAGGMAIASVAGETTEEDRQNIRRVEELVSACMRERGFEYVPVSPDSGDVEDPFEEAYSLDPEEFAEQYGYGISTLSSEAFGADEDVDPNQEIRDGLSEAAQEEYDKAMWGDTSQMVVSEDGTATEPGPIEEPEDPDEQGCQLRASQEVFGDVDEQVGLDKSEFAGMFDDLSALRERIANDPRVIEATQDWAECMAAAGYAGFTEPIEAQNAVFERMEEVYGSNTENEGADQEAGVVDIDPADVDPAELEELQEYERTVATADFACQEHHYRDVHDEVTFELEEQFVDEHREELDRYRDAFAEGPVGHAGGVG